MKDNECFKLCHIRFIIPQDKHTERIKKTRLRNC